MCQTGFYRKDNLCFICSEKCARCTNEGVCSECITGFVRYEDGLCIKPHSDAQTFIWIIGGVILILLVIFLIRCIKQSNKNTDDSIYNLDHGSKKKKNSKIKAINSDELDLRNTNPAVKFVALTKNYKEDFDGPYVASDTDSMYASEND